MNIHSLRCLHFGKAVMFSVLEALSMLVQAVGYCPNLLGPERT